MRTVRDGKRVGGAPAHKVRPRPCPPNRSISHELLQLVELLDQALVEVFASTEPQAA